MPDTPTPTPHIPPTPVLPSPENPALVRVAEALLGCMTVCLAIIGVSYWRTLLHLDGLVQFIGVLILVHLGLILGLARTLKWAYHLTILLATVAAIVFFPLAQIAVTFMRIGNVDARAHAVLIGGIYTVLGIVLLVLLLTRGVRTVFAKVPYGR
jgi:hypothetical protein